MNLPQLKDIEELYIEKNHPFVKYRVLDQYNAFPCLLITAIEQLIIKRCFSFAFEVFFCIMNEISESQEIKLIQKHKQALAEFTCAMQSKKLSNFKQLQQQKIFYDIINEIGEMADFEDINQTLLYLKTLFKQFKVNIKLLDIVSN